uniref:Mobile element protein n=1 Tax=Vibrio tasmaniensis TaxID=212663 RepID=A0A0H3ZXA6_9VIBR|nr:Mobile element protein [Vibrio tasmaniensis]
MKKPSISGLQKRKIQVFTLTQFELDRLLSGFTIIGHEPIKINDFTMS